MFPFDLLVHQWGKTPRVGNSRLSDVYATPAPAGSQNQIMDAWSSGCVDTKRRDLLIFGGGHTDYAGNEVYAFKIPELFPSKVSTAGTPLTWRIKNFYSTAGAGDTEAAPGGGPASRHTYSGLTYSAARDRMVAVGGVVWGPTGGFSNGTWEMDCSVESPSSMNVGAWTQKDNIVAFPTGGFDAITVVDANGHVWYRALWLAEFDPTASPGSQWSDRNDFQNGPPTISMGACLIPGFGSVADRMVTCGGGSGNGSDGVTVQRLVTPWAYEGGGENAYGTTGDTILEADGGIGMGWEPNIGRIVAWNGDAFSNLDTYELDPVTRIWRRQLNFGDVPDAPTGNGTFGRFAYLGGCGPEYAGLWILVNTTTSDVFFYRSSPGPFQHPSGPAPWASRLGA